MRWGLILLAAAIMHATTNTDPVVADELSVGMATVDITPPIGMRMSGYFNERLATGVHDPLLAKAIAFRQGDTRAVLVFCDLIGISPQVSTAARAAASKQTGVPVTNITIAATHSHTGPLYAGELREHYHRLAISRVKSDPKEPIDYSAVLTQRLVKVIAEAEAKVRPRQLVAGMLTQEGLSFNRRFHMKDGTVVFNPGKLNANIIRPAGPIDPGLGLLLVREAGQTHPVAGLSSFALHLDTVGGAEYGADYPYHLEQALRKAWGEYFTSLWGTGTCGDINHIDVTHDRPQKGNLEAKRIGDTLAKTVLAGASTLRPISDPQLAVKAVTLQVPLQQFSSAEIELARLNMFKVGTPELPFLSQVRACTIMDLQLRKGPHIPLDVQVFRLDKDTAIVCLPGEVFVELGLAIKRQSPFKTTLVVELCNDSPAYIPTKKAFAEGSYEIVNSRIQPGEGEKLAEAAVKLLKDLDPANPPKKP